MNNLLKRIWGLRKWRRLSSVVLRRLGISQYFTIRTNGIELIFHPTVWNMNLWENSEAFRKDTEILYRFLRLGDTVIDLGANVGLITLVAAKIVSDVGMVYSVEPHPQIYRFLAANIEHNRVSNVRSYNVAVGNSDGVASFSNGICDDGNHIILGKEGDIKVPVNRLDTLLPEVGTVKLLKIDVEGFEKYVLQGARKVLAVTRCIYFESSSILFERYGYTSKDVFSLLRQNGFVITQVVSIGQLRLIDDDYVSRQIENLIAIKDLEEFKLLTGFRLV